jgi:hypothetical protein
MFYKDNWLVWSFDGVEYGPKTSPTDVMGLKLIPTIKETKSYYTELCLNAIRIKEKFGSNLSLLFSGGVDSEIILRVYKDLKIPLNVFIFKYENNFNYRDVACAIRICESLNCKFTIIDFNLKKFFENDAYDIWTKCYTDTSGRLPQMAFSNYVDGVSIMGSGEPEWRKQTDNTWKFELDESDKIWSVYNKTIGKNVICDWYEYSPEIIVSHLKLPYVQKLLNNEIPGKLSSVSSKGLIHKNIWPDLEIRQKLVGFEHDQTPGSKPDFMIAFENEFINGKVNCLNYKFTQDELLALICFP